ncbi:MAG: hypothetical protein R3C69_09920 [Geminicoccaceae bacterium]
MVEQVARGRLKVAAVAALGLATVGATAPASAAGKSTTMQIRVRVVESCQIRIDKHGSVGRCRSAAAHRAIDPIRRSRPSHRSPPSADNLRSAAAADPCPADRVAGQTRLAGNVAQTCSLRHFHVLSTYRAT